LRILVTIQTSIQTRTHTHLGFTSIVVDFVIILSYRRRRSLHLSFRGKKKYIEKSLLQQGVARILLSTALRHVFIDPSTNYLRNPVMCSVSMRRVVWESASELFSLVSRRTWNFRRLDTFGWTALMSCSLREEGTEVDLYIYYNNMQDIIIYHLAVKNDTTTQKYNRFERWSRWKRRRESCKRRTRKTRPEIKIINKKKIIIRKRNDDNGRNVVSYL